MKLKTVSTLKVIRIKLETEHTFFYNLDHNKFSLGQNKFANSNTPYLECP